MMETQMESATLAAPQGLSQDPPSEPSPGASTPALATPDSATPDSATGNRVLLTLHGLGRMRRCMRPLSKALSVRLGAEPLNFEYASTRGRIIEHATALDRVLAQIPEGTRIDIVAHSMGNIVARRWFAMREAARSVASAGLQFGRMVMLGPPSQGSTIARRLHNRWLFRTLLGPAGQELGRGWPTVAADLPEPPVPFGILAGRLPRWILNPLLPECSDFIVTVEETKLPGASDFAIVGSPHATMMRSRRVIEAAATFLETGRFPEELPRV